MAIIWARAMLTGNPSSTIGRFYPHHFDYIAGAITAACNNVTYLSQPALGVSYQLQASNSNDDVVTNYNTSLGYPTGSVSHVAEANNNGADLGARLSIAAIDWAAGEYNLSDSQAVLLRHSDQSLIQEAPLLNLPIGVIVNDNDGAILTTTDMNATTTGDCSSDNGCNAATIGSSDFYYGRLRLADAYGPETAELPVNFHIEYWNGNQYQRQTPIIVRPLHAT